MKNDLSVAGCARLIVPTVHSRVTARHQLRVVG